MRRDIAFLHIPKAAGTSLRESLESVCAEHRILRDYGSDRVTTPELRDLFLAGRLKEFRKVFNRERDGILLSGHFPASRYWEHFHAESFVTFVRDPVDRVVSEYNHFMTHNGWTAPFEEFVRTPRFRNVISRHLAGANLDVFGFIGFVESYERDLAALSDFLGADIPQKRLNLGRYSSDDARLAANEDARSLVAQFNAEDIAIYAQLKARRFSNPAVQKVTELPEDGYRGRVRRKPDGSVHGWLYNTTREVICDVEFVQNGRVLGTAKAENYRERVKLGGASRTGLCGFRCGMTALGAMGVLPNIPINIRASRTNFELDGSPITFL